MEVIKKTAVLLTHNNETRDEILKAFENEPFDLIVATSANELDGQQNYLLYLIDQDIIDATEELLVPTHAYLVVLAHDKSFESARRLMKKRAYDIVVVPEEISQLHEVMQTVEVSAVQSAAMIDRDHLASGMVGGGRVLGFYSAKGGAGKTTISSLVAQHLKAQHDKKVLLIDLNVQYGGQEVLLGLESVRTYIDLKPVLRELDIHHIHNITAHNEASNLDVLLSPCQPEQAEELTDDLISALIRTARTHYDYVILDIPSDINDTSFTALNESTEIYYILTPDSLSLRSYRHAMNLFERLNLERFENVHILLNQEHDKSELTNKDISNLIDRKIAGNFHSDYLKLQPYINLGEPVFTSEKKAKFKLAKDVSGFVKRQLLTAKKEG